jgi:tetratricopeptide (TPR) repeat protein
MRNFLLFFILLTSTSIYSFQKDNSLLNSKKDTSTVNELNKLGYMARLTDPEQTINYAIRAKSIANDLKFVDGEAEANRIQGIGNSYLNQKDSALSYYLIALELYKNGKNELGEAKVSNNIGNLWTEVDYDKALTYYKNALKIAVKFKIKDLIAGCYLNVGNAYYRKKNYSVALKNYEKSSILFNEINNPIGITQSLQNRGVIYYSLNQFDKAEFLLLQANTKAKEFELNSSVSSINLNLTSIYIAKGNFEKAEQFLNEGLAFAKIVKNDKIIYDFTYSYYELERKRKNFEKALYYLKEVHNQDSVNYKKNISSNINLIQETLKQQQQQKENELIIAKQKYSNTLFIASAIVAILAFFVIFLLIRINKKSTENNKELTALNEEVTFQKQNVDRINHKLEEIITERTKDLIYKNQKLSEYSSHLSHQIRGPIATLKGLVMLIEGDMVKSEDVVPQIKKCVDEIDNQIMDINEALHDPTRSHLHTK